MHKHLWIAILIIASLMLASFRSLEPSGFPLVENFDSVTAPGLPAMWIATVSAGLSSNNWRTVTSQVHTPLNSAFAPAPSTVHDIRLESPALSITSSNAQVYFYQRYSFEAGLGTGYDGGVLEISYNGGAYTDILATGGSFLTGGYNGSLSSIFSNPLGGRAAWIGTLNQFTLTVVSLPANTAGQSIRLRWRLGTDSNNPGSGWFIDTVTVTDNQGEQSPSIISSFPADGEQVFSAQRNLEFNFSEPVNLFPPLLELVCNNSGFHDSTVTSNTLTMWITPVGSLIPGETCVATVLANRVADMDNIDPPDQMLANYVVTFKVAAAAIYLPLVYK